MRRPLTVLLALTLLLAMTALGSVAGADDDPSSVTVVHGVPGLTVDVYVDGAPLLTDFEPGDTAGPLELPPATYAIAVRAAGADPSSSPALAGDVEVPSGRNISLVAHRAANGTLRLTAFVNDDSRVITGQGRLTVRHTAAAPSVDVRVGGDVVFSGVANGQEGTADLPAGTLSAVDVVLAGTSTVALGPVDLPVPAGRSTIVYAVGSAAAGDLALVVQTLDGLPTRESGRLSGPGRIETAVAISQRGFPDGADTVYLARGDNWPDAMAGGTLTDGPILIVTSCAPVPEVVKAEIRRLDPDDVIALGGTAAICDDTLADALSS